MCECAHSCALHPLTTWNKYLPQQRFNSAHVSQPWRWNQAVAVTPFSWLLLQVFMGQWAEMVLPAHVSDKYRPCAALGAGENPGFTSCHWVNWDLFTSWILGPVYSASPQRKDVREWYSQVQHWVYSPSAFFYLFIFFHFYFASNLCSMKHNWPGFSWRE